MTATRPAKGRAAPQFAALVAVLLSAQAALAQNPFNPYGSFTDSGPVTPEERTRREQVRTDLYDRLSPDYRLDMALVSEASIAASIERTMINPSSPPTSASPARSG